MLYADDMSSMYLVGIVDLCNSLEIEERLSRNLAKVSAWLDASFF